jgi:hypothetical protein
LIRRYGMPQITHIAANRSHPRRDIEPLTSCLSPRAQR